MSSVKIGGAPEWNDFQKMRDLAATVRTGERFWHLNTGEMYAVVNRDGQGRLRIRRPDRSVWVWPDYLLNPHNFERKGPPVVLR